MRRSPTGIALEQLPGFIQQALQQALRDELELDKDYDLAPRDAAARVRDIFECALFDFLGGQRSIMRLPTELLVEALSYLKFKDRISVSHVCRRWRSVSLSAPRLWSYLSSDAIRVDVPCALASLLERTQGAPVSLDVILNDANIVEVSQCLTHHLHHIRSLHLQVQYEPGQSLQPILREAMRSEAPILHHLSLWDIRTDASWLLGEAPSLSRLKLNGNVDLLSASAYLHMRRLFFLPFEDTLASSLPTVLDRMPALDTLVVSLASSKELSAELPQETIQRLNSLDSFGVVVETSRLSLALILPWLSCLTIPHITLSWARVSRRRNAVSETVCAMIENMGQIDSLSIYYAAGLNIDMRDTRGVERSFLDIPVALRPDAAVFSRLTQLSVSELAWTIGDVLPPAPALLQLRIFLLRPWSNAPGHGPVEYDGAGIFFLAPHTHARALVCPRLRRVEFIARSYNGIDPSDEQTIVAPLQIREFLAWQLVYDSQVLDALAFTGVMLLQSHVRDMAALFAMARDVDFDPRRPSDLRPLSDLMSWDWP